MKDTKRGCKKKQRRDTAEVRKKAAPFSEQKYHPRRPSRRRSPIGAIAKDSGPFLKQTPRFAARREGLAIMSITRLALTILRTQFFTCKACLACDG
jgi:hypothetical protein